METLKESNIIFFSSSKEKNFLLFYF